MTRLYLLAFSTLIACAAKPSLFGENLEGDTEGDTETGDTESRIAWTYELSGVGLTLALDESDQPVVFVRNYDPYESSLLSVSPDGAPLDNVSLPGTPGGAVNGADVVWFEDVMQGGYELHRLEDEAWSYGPTHLGGWPSALRRAEDGSLRVTGNDVDREGYVAYLDVFDADGSLATTWTQSTGDIHPNVEIVAVEPDGSTVVWVELDDLEADHSTATLLRISAEGDEVASTSLDLGNSQASIPARTGAGWTVAGVNQFGVWTQTVDDALTVFGPRVVDDESLGGAPIMRTVGLDDGVVVVQSVGSDDEGHSAQLRRYDLLGALVSTTTLPYVDSRAMGQSVLGATRAGSVLYLAGYDAVDDGTETTLMVGWLTRVDL